MTKTFYFSLEQAGQASKSATIEMYAPSSYNDTMTGETLSSVSEKSETYSQDDNDDRPPPPIPEVPLMPNRHMLSQVRDFITLIHCICAQIFILLFVQRLHILMEATKVARTRTLSQHFYITLSLSVFEYQMVVNLFDQTIVESF